MEIIMPTGKKNGAISATLTFISTALGGGSVVESSAYPEKVVNIPSS